MVKNFSFHNTEIDGLKLIDPFISYDNRGYFMKYYEKDIFLENGVVLNSYEENQSFSMRGVLRGLHFQTLNSQSKLIRVIKGEIFDVAVDLRPESSTFGKWQGFYLSEKNKQMLFIPENFAHGFLTISGEAVISYICGDKYSPEYDSGIIWNDESINVKWPLDSIDKLIISEKDSCLMKFCDYTDKVN